MAPEHQADTDDSFASVASAKWLPSHTDLDRSKGKGPEKNPVVWTSHLEAQMLFLSVPHVSVCDLLTGALLGLDNRTFFQLLLVPFIVLCMMVTEAKEKSKDKQWLRAGIALASRRSWCGHLTHCSTVHILKRQSRMNRNSVCCPKCFCCGLGVRT